DDQAAFVDRCHERPLADEDLAEGKARIIVETEYGVAWEALEEAVLDHQLGAAEILLRRLEDEMDRAVEIAAFGQQPGGTEEHGRMPVMSTGMHQPFRLAGVFSAGLFVDRQCIDIGAD